jgi:peptidyl-tRNA hydrolase, PTH2 family
MASATSASAVLDKTQPSTIALSISTLLLGLVAGYFVGSGNSIGLFGSTASSSSTSSKRKKQVPKSSWPNSYDVNVQQGDSSDEEFARAIHTGKNDDDDADDEENTSDEESEDETLDPTALKELSNTTEEVKLMLVVRTDLGMTKGKIAAQCGHATLAVYKALVGNAEGAPMLKRWEYGGQAKVAVKCETEEDLLLLQGQAISLGLVARVIRDAGRTQIQANSATVLGVLGPKSVVDKVTGGLKLL